jgi:hypothetical protein
MPAIDYSAHVTNPAAFGPVAAVASAASAGTPDFSFADFLDIVNPLEHIPVISTIYRAITGDRPGTFEKIAGDSLYGGFVGFVSSLADTAFQAITGKDVGDTVLAFLTGDDATQTAASDTPAEVTPAAAITGPDVSALVSALSGKGVDSETAARAVTAYGRSISLLGAVPELQPY